MKIKFNRSVFLAFLKMYFWWFIIFTWVLWLCRAYLDLNIYAWPSSGKDYIMGMQNQYMWTLFQKCGGCFFWNGFTNGGAPSFVDVLAGWFHPITIAATLMFGVFNSGKIIVILSLTMAGIAQWWLGKVFNLSKISRIWTALLLVSSGALIGRMEIGSVPLVLSTAACMLVIPAAINLTRQGGIKNVVTLGMILGLAFLSGQGYIQIGLIGFLVPMIIFLLIESSPEKLIVINANWRNFIYAFLFAILIAAPLIIPFAHILPIYGKEIDTSFSSSQPFQYTALNLVIRDPDFYHTTVLGKSPFPFRYINFIGWIPVIFALFGLARSPKQPRKMLIYLCTSIGMLFLMSSAEFFQILKLVFTETIAAGLRNPAVIQGLAVPHILILAGLGIDHLLDRQWPKISMTLLQSNLKLGVINTNIIKSLLLLALMGLALKSTADFSKRWLYVEKIDYDPLSILAPLKTMDSQWVQPPVNEFVWLPAAIESGMKIRNYFRPWGIDTPEMPKAYLELSRDKGDVNLPEYQKTLGVFNLLKRPDNVYAYLTEGEKKTACQASSVGGFIDVVCESSESGLLQVQERALSGWNVWVDGQKKPMTSGPWLSVKTSPGKHIYSFRYQPWDAPLGLGLALIGWAAALIGFFNPANLASRAVLQYGKRASGHAGKDGGT